MNIHKLAVSFLVVVLTFPFRSAMPAIIPADNQVQQSILSSIRGNRGDEITKYLNTLTDFDIPGNRGTYSKPQGGRILEDFLTKNPVKECTVISTGTSADGGEYTVGNLKAGGETYRLYFVLKEVDGKWLIHIFKITPQ